MVYIDWSFTSGLLLLVACFYLPFLYLIWKCSCIFGIDMFCLDVRFRQRNEMQNYFLICFLATLNGQYVFSDRNKSMVLHFSVCGMDVLIYTIWLGGTAPDFPSWLFFFSLGLKVVIWKWMSKIICSPSGLADCDYSCLFWSVKFCV